MDALLRSGYVEEGDAEDGVVLDALSAYVRTENFEEREQTRLPRPGGAGVREGARMRGLLWPERLCCCNLSGRMRGRGELPGTEE